MSHILVTGANGFIGRALVNELLMVGHDITAIVRDPAAAPPWRDSVRRLSLDMTESTDWRDALTGVERIVHLAGIAHQPIADDEATVARYRQVNLEGTIALAEAAARAGVKRLLFLSSVKVNGERTAQRPFTERDTAAPQDIYGRTKWQAEQALTRIAAESALEFTVLRSPLVYGPGVGGNFAALLRLCDSALPLPFGAIDNRRSLIARANLTHAIAACLDHPAAANETFLLRDGTDLSTADLVRCLRRGLGRPARLLAVPPGLLVGLGRLTGRGDKISRLVGSLVVDDRKLRATVGWQPPLQTGPALTEAAMAFRATASP